MTKSEFYNQIYKLISQITSDEKMYSNLTEMCDIIIKECRRKDCKETHVETMYNKLINYCLQIGAISTIKYIISNNITLSDDTNCNLLSDIQERIEIDLHNFKHITNRPYFAKTYLIK